MSQAKIKKLAKTLFGGKVEVWIDGGSSNGGGKWTADLAVDGSARLQGTGGTKRIATEDLLRIVEELHEGLCPEPLRDITGCDV